METRTLSRLLLIAAMLPVGVGAVGGAQSVAAVNPILKPFTGPRSELIEPYTAYDGQTKCSGGAKPGTLAFAKFLQQRFGSAYIGIKRSCAGDSVSEHKEGRALDWGISARTVAGRSTAKRAIRMLFKDDWWGNDHAMARRLGIMYIIWNKRMWRSYRPDDGWQPYEGSNPHTSHMHISFSRLGGRGLTSYWTGKIADVPPAYTGGGGWHTSMLRVTP